MEKYKFKKTLTSKEKLSESLIYKYDDLKSIESFKSDLGFFIISSFLNGLPVEKRNKLNSILLSKKTNDNIKLTLRATDKSTIGTINIDISGSY